MGWFLLAERAVQHPQAAVAVGLERAHAEFVSQGKGLTVVIFGLLALWGITPRRDVTEDPQGIRLVATFLARTGERQRLLGGGPAPPPGGRPASAPPPGRDD